MLMNGRYSEQAKQAGFTIVETLIVLAIAGLIMLITFEAIPSLERNSRNNQRRQDVQNILGAVVHYELNNSAILPGNGSNFLQYAKLTYYARTATYIPPSASLATTGVNETVFADWSSASSSLSNTNTETVNIFNYQKCSGNTSTKASAGYTDVVALYAVETSNNSNPTPQCQQA